MIFDTVQEACYLAKIPSDVLVMKASHPKIGFVRAALVAAGSTERFSTTFGTSSNLQVPAPPDYTCLVVCAWSLVHPDVATTDVGATCVQKMVAYVMPPKAKLVCVCMWT